MTFETLRNSMLKGKTIQAIIIRKECKKFAPPTFNMGLGQVRKLVDEMGPVKAIDHLCHCMDVHYEGHTAR